MIRGLMLVLRCIVILVARPAAWCGGWRGPSRRGPPRGRRPAPGAARAELVRDRICNTFLPRARALARDGRRPRGALLLRGLPRQGRSSRPRERRERSDGLKADIVEVARRLYARGLIGGNEGNVSARDGDVLYITPAGVCKGFLTPSRSWPPTSQGRAAGRRARFDRGPDAHRGLPPPARRERGGARAPAHRHRLRRGRHPPRPRDHRGGGGDPGPRPHDPLRHALDRRPGRATSARPSARPRRCCWPTTARWPWATASRRAWERMETLEQLARVALVARSLGREQELPGQRRSPPGGRARAAGYPPPVCVDCPTCGHLGAGGGGRPGGADPRRAGAARGGSGGALLRVGRGLDSGPGGSESASPERYEVARGRRQHG